VEVHTPNATRPWQHVLEPLSGYLMLGQALYLSQAPTLVIDPSFLDEKNIISFHPGKVFHVNQLSKDVTYISPKNFATNWNFGPEGEMTVLEVLKVAKDAWPKIKYVIKEEETHPSMTQLLKIDSTKSHKELNWKPRWNMEEAIRRTVEWYKAYYEEGFIKTHHDIEDYEGGKVNEL
jgi:CDP-glucose 4,6-dehydratase